VFNYSTAFSSKLYATFNDRSWAVKNGQFHIATMNTVADGVQHLMGKSLEEINQLAMATLTTFKKTVEQNMPKNIKLD